jgi:uracil phosphoribosyltransferase
MYILTETNHIAATYLAELRDLSVQQNRMRFRRNLERLGMALAMELSKSMTYVETEVSTPLGSKKVNVLANQPILITVMRASLPLYNGFLEVFDQADTAFIGAYRSAHKADHSFEIALEYIASPSIEGREIVLLDPMLATGRSLLQSYQAICRYGKPAKVHIVAAIASAPGLAFIEKELPEAQLWIGDIDPILNDHAYIVPGLGDAGDLSFGEKL